MEQIKHAQAKATALRQNYQYLLDKSVPHTSGRWLVLLVLLLAFLARVVLGQGWYVICYALFIYLLNLLLGFLTPKFDMSVQDDLMSNAAEEGDALPTSAQDEFKPFMRRVPEFQCWYNAVRGVVVALALSVTRLTDLPVFWPVLVLYFVVLLFLTLRRQIQHMVKYRYIPFDLGKKRYKS